MSSWVRDHSSTEHLPAGYTIRPLHNNNMHSSYMHSFGNGENWGLNFVLDVLHTDPLQVELSLNLVENRIMEFILAERLTHHVCLLREDSKLDTLNCHPLERQLGISRLLSEVVPSVCVLGQPKVTHFYHKIFINPVRVHLKKKSWTMDSIV